MSKQKAFKPDNNATITVAPNAASAAVKISGTGESLRIFNPTNGIVWWKVGADNTVAAAVTDNVVPAGADRLFDIGTGPAAQSDLWISVFQAVGATGGPVYVSRGDGNTMQ